ncbi:MAG TPA: NTP transferase domain-containing protein, partial [Acidimicrobiales bacterium]
DKALIPVGGTPMVVRVAEALWVAGARDVIGVGREPHALAAHRLATVSDRQPGAGPAAGIATALAWADGDELVMVVGCDLVAPSPDAIGATLAALAGNPAAGVAVPVSGGRTQWHHAAWRPSAGPALERALDAGARAVGAVVAAAGLAVVGVDGIEPAVLADADVPGELPLEADG